MLVLQISLLKETDSKKMPEKYPHKEMKFNRSYWNVMLHYFYELIIVYFVNCIGFDQNRQYFKKLTNATASTYEI